MARYRFPALYGPVCLLALLLSPTWIRADEPQDAASPPSSPEIAKWIKDLDSDEFQVRQQASDRLIAAGKQAAAQVAKAAEGDSAEVTARCLDVLGKLLRSADGETKAEAKKALEGLSQSKNTAVARQAQALVNPGKVASWPPAPPPAPGAGPGAVPRVIIGGIGVAGPGMRVSTKTIDGHKTIEAEEAGKKTKIEESAKGEIKVEITEALDGKDKVSKYEAKDAEELKKKHPEVHALYEKYSKFAPGVAVRFGIGPGGLPGGAIPGGIAPARPFRVGVVPQKALDQIEEAM
jgi:hypothetical protein